MGVILRTSLFKIQTPVPQYKNNVVVHCKSNCSCNNHGFICFYGMVKIEVKVLGSRIIQY